MPCCFATLHFRQCRHSMLFKLGCSKPECTDICPNKRRQFLLQTEYMWRCEDCVEFQYKQESDLRAAKWDAYHARLRTTIGMSPESRSSLTMTARNKETREEVAEDQHRSSCVEEVQRVVDWVEEYGGLVWDLVYGHKRDFEASKNRLQFLRAAKYWDLVIVLDYVRKPQEPWDNENFPPCIEELIQAGRIRPARRAAVPETPRSAGRPSALPAFVSFQPGMCRTAVIDEAAELTQRMTGIALHGLGASSGLASGSSSDVEPVATRNISPDDRIPRSFGTEMCTPYEAHTFNYNVNVVVKDADASETPSTQRASCSIYKTTPEAGLQEDDKDEDEEEPNHIW
ncbi:unnamed protein product, partial [Clonostachys solani]